MISSDWVRPPLGSLVEAIVPGRAKPEELSGPIPWLRIEDFDGKYIESSKSGQGVFPEQLIGTGLKVFSPGTVVCTCSCDMGTTAIVRKPLITNQTFIGLRPRDDQLSSEFLYYSLQAHRAELNASATGAIQTYLSREDFTSLRLPIPPRPMQSAIADFLDRETVRIDALIEKKRVLEEVLAERLEASLSKELLAEDELPYDQVFGLVIQARAPACAEGIRTLRQTGATVLTGPFGTQFAASEYAPGGVPMVNPTHIKAGSFRPDSDSAVTSETAKRLSRYWIKAGDIVIGRKGDVGRAALATNEHEGWILGSDCIAIRTAGSSLEGEYLAGLFLLKRIRDQLVATSTGTTMANVNESVLLNLRVPVPSIQEQRHRITNARRAWDEIQQLRESIERQVALLAEHRQSLITAAVTGQLKIPETA